MSLAAKMKAAAEKKLAEEATKGGEPQKRAQPDTPLSPSARPAKQINLGGATVAPAPAPTAAPRKGKGAIFVPDWDVSVHDSFATNTEVGLKVMRELSKLDPGFSVQTTEQHLLGVFENQARSLRSTYDLILKNQARAGEEDKVRARARQAEERVKALEKRVDEEVTGKAKMAEEHARIVAALEEKLQRAEAERVKAGDEALAAYKFTGQFYDDSSPLVAFCSRVAYFQALQHVNLRYPEVNVAGLHFECSRPAEIPGPEATRCGSDKSLVEPTPIDGRFGEEEAEGGGESEGTSRFVPEESSVPPPPEV